MKVEPLEPGQETALVGVAAGALEVEVKTLAGVHAHWYPVLEIVVVTVTVEGPGAGVAEAAAEVETMPTNRPPMMLELVLAPLTALFR
jgi:hypothetical protein